MSCPVRLPAVWPGAVVVLLLISQAATAQQFSYGGDERRAIQSLSFGYTALDFQYNGGGTPHVSFAFSEPAYGAVYTRPNLFASVAFGEQAAIDTSFGGRPLRLVDVRLTTWGEFFLTRPGAPGRPRLFLPIALHTDYRRVSRKGDENSLTEAFNITVLGAGTGLGFESALGKRAVFEARATPMIGLALRNFGDSAGSSWLVDTDAQLHLGPLAGRLGLSLGYAFRYQAWNIAASSLLGEVTQDLFDYTDLHHVFRVGINW